jgi:ketosteroid isomerase-like protein
MAIRLMAFVVTIWLVCTAFAAPVTNDDPVNDELRQLHKLLTEAVNKGDIDSVLEHCAADIIFTPSDGDVCRGKPAVRAYFERMMESPNKRFQSFTTDATVDGHLIYPGPTIVAWGPSKDHYKLSNGMEFTVDSRWTATLIKEGDRWFVANIHVSCNLFDNPMLNLARQMLFWGAGVAGGGGLLVGLLLGWILKRRANR